MPPSSIHKWLLHVIGAPGSQRGCGGGPQGASPGAHALRAEQGAACPNQARRAAIALFPLCLHRPAAQAAAMFASTSLLHQRVQLQAARSPAASRAHRRMAIVARGSGRFFIGGEPPGPRLV